MTNRYTLAARLLHWLMAFGFAVMWASGYSMAELVEEDTPLEEFLFELHFTSGVTLLVLLALRVAVRLTHTPPPLPAGIRPLEALGAHVAHYALYLLPAIIIAIGYAETNISGHAVRWFGIAMLLVFPALEEPSGEVVVGWLETLHMWFAYTMLGVVVVHVAGAVKHLLDGHDVLYRMTLP